MAMILDRATGLMLSVLLAATTSGCLLGGSGCTAEEADQMTRMEHYASGELVPEDDGLGGCGASFSTTDDPLRVIEHYRSTLQAAGWTIDPSPEGGDNGSGVSLSARKAPYGMSVSAELLGAPETPFVIHVNSIDPDG